GRLVQKVLPWYLRGFFAAVVIGAILSSFNSVLNSSVTLFSLGVYRDMLHADATDKDVINSGKYFGTIVAVASMLMAPMLIGQESIFGYLQKMNGLYFIPILSVMAVGMFTKRVPAKAAQIGLVLSFLTIILVYFVPPVTKLFSPIHDFHFLGLVFACTVGLMLVIGQISPSPEPYVQKDVNVVDMTPWKPAWYIGIALVAIVLTIYIALADFSVVFGG
ncbi:MAG: solute:sodium symporter family transporter, partial [Planctomycetaceae bacterium]|nr:solute:sodium symporter family transporter [Planctomycetaceae bacterium]